MPVAVVPVAVVLVAVAVVCVVVEVVFVEVVFVVDVVDVAAAAVVLVAVAIADAGFGAVLAAFALLAIATRRLLLINPLRMKLVAAPESERAYLSPRRPGDCY